MIVIPLLWGSYGHIKTGHTERQKPPGGTSVLSMSLVEGHRQRVGGQEVLGGTPVPVSRVSPCRFFFVFLEGKLLVYI